MKLAVVLLLTVVVLLKTADSEVDSSKESNSGVNRTSDRGYYGVDGTTVDLNADDINDEETCRRIRQEKKKMTNDVWEKCEVIQNANVYYWQVEYEQCRDIEKYYEKSFVRQDIKIACDRLFLERDADSLSVTKTREKCERVLKKTGEKYYVSMKVKLRCLDLAYNPGEYLDFPICQRLGLINLNEEPATTIALPTTTNAPPTTTIAPPTTTIAPPTTTIAITTPEVEGLDPPRSINASPRLLYVSSFQDKCSTIARFLKIDDDTALNILGFQNTCQKIYDYEIPIDILSSKAPTVKEHCPELMKSLFAEG